MAVFGDLIKEAVGGHFFTKISIPNNTKEYKETLGVALTFAHDQATQLERHDYSLLELKRDYHNQISKCLQGKHLPAHHFVFQE